MDDDHIQETPLKRRRLDEAGRSQGHSSSGPSSPTEQETVATLPLPPRTLLGRTDDRSPSPIPTSDAIEGDGYKTTSHTRQTALAAGGEAPTQATISLPSYPAHRVAMGLAARDDGPSSSSGLHSYPLPPSLQPATQPTQPWRASSPASVEEVQVPASSPPARVSPPPFKKTMAKDRPLPGRLALSMAPPGTAFRAPIQRGPERAQPITIDSDEDEGMPYVGGSSTDDDAQKKDIKPTEPKLRQAQKQQTSFQGSARDFSRLVNQFSFSKKSKQGASKTSPQSATFGAAGTYAGKDSGKSASMRQQFHMTIDDIEDYQQRTKVRRMKDILGQQWTVAIIYETLLKRHGNVDDAMEYLIEKEPTDFDQIDLTSPVSERDHLAGSPGIPKQSRAKQTLNAPVKRLHERYVRDIPSPEKKRPPRRRLMQGTRKRSPEPEPESSSPVEKSSSAQSTPKSTSKEVTQISDDSDSGIVTDGTSDLLSFFNNSSPAELMDLASVSESVAQLILSHAPFRSLSHIRKIEDPAAVSGRRKRTTVGEKVLDASEEMWAGYQAVDKLVAQCDMISKPIRQEMEKWGVNIFGTSGEGEVGLLSLENGRDSGIGTPVTTNSDGEDDRAEKMPSKTKPNSRFFPQPELMDKGATLKDYQVVGINWLDLLFRRKLSGILADDMGLGKTCQVVAFLARLKETGQKGPHIVVVPTSTLENWIREFRRFCSALDVFPYHGSQSERLNEFQLQIEDSQPDVILTTYHIAQGKEDRKFLRGLDPVVCVFDEGHMLKNTASARYQQLMSIRCQFRLLLTGTPLQNNLKELVSLLGFLLPQVFSQHTEALESIFRHRAKTGGSENTEDDTSHAALLSATRIAKAKAMLSPFVLRRTKAQVLATLPPKTRRVQYCDMTEKQAELYHAELARLKALLALPKGTRKDPENVLMILRKAAIHPWLFRRQYTDDMVNTMAKAFHKRFPDRQETFIIEELSEYTDEEVHKLVTEDDVAAPVLRRFALPGTPWMDSGKVHALVGLLQSYAANGDRALVFSQFTTVLNILERVLQEADIKFMRLDGQTPIGERQPLLDQFATDTSIPAFLLSTKAGGAGINLAAANKVVIFDASFNPQDDVQAENRAHRVGQTRAVDVVRLVTRGTIEEQILELGRTKLALGNRVAGEAPEAEEETEGHIVAESAADEIDSGAEHAVTDADRRDREREGQRTVLERLKAEVVGEKKKK